MAEQKTTGSGDHGRSRDREHRKFRGVLRGRDKEHREFRVGLCGG